MRDALRCLHAGDRASARRYLEAIRDADDKAALGLLAVCLMDDGEVDDAEQCFTRAIALPKGAHGYVSFDCVFAYLKACRRAKAWGPYATRAEILADAYGAFGITDASFLGIRGLNPFETFVDDWLAALDAGCSAPPEEPWQILASRIDSEGRAYLERLFDRCEWTMQSR